MTIFSFLQNSPSLQALLFCMLPCFILFFDLFVYSTPSVPFFKKETCGFCSTTEEALHTSGIDSFWSMLAFVLGLSIVFCLLYFIVRLPWGLGFFAAFALSWYGLGVNFLFNYSRNALKCIDIAEKDQALLEVFLLSDDVAAQNISLSPQEETAQKSLQKAKEEVGMLVWYNVSDMDISALYRCLAEGLLVQFQRSCATPFFWLCFFGPAGVWLVRIIELFAQPKNIPTDFSRLAVHLYGFCTAVPDGLTACFLRVLMVSISNRKIAVSTKVVQSQARLSSSFYARQSMAASAWLYHAKCNTYINTTEDTNTNTLGADSTGINATGTNSANNVNVTDEIAGTNATDGEAIGISDISAKKGFLGPITGVWTQDKVSALVEDLHKVSMCFMLGVPFVLLTILLFLRLILL